MTSDNGEQPDVGRSGEREGSRLFKSDTAKIFNSVSGIVGAVSAIITVVALYAHGSTSILLWSIGVTAVAAAVLLLVQVDSERTLNIKVRLKLLATVSAVVAVVAAGGIYLYVTHPAHRGSAASASPLASASATLGARPATPTTAPGSPPIRHQGRLTLLGNGTTDYDLDSKASDWGVGNGSWTWQNVQYLPVGDDGEPTLDIANAPESDVLMGTAGGWTYHDCSNATYIDSDNNNPNAPVGVSAIGPGRGICVLTIDNTSAKKDGGHYVLLQVIAISNRSITLKITVWQ